MAVVTVRPIANGELESYIRTMFWAAGRPVDNAFVDEQRRTFTLERALAAFDGRELIGTVGTRPLRMTLPGGKSVPIAAIGQGGVLPSHTRMGVMRELMMRSFLAARESGEPLAAWTTSEWPLYERYGGGVGTFSATYLLRKLGHEAIRRDSTTESRARVGEVDQALTELPELHARASTRVGGVARPASYWQLLVDRLRSGRSQDPLESRTDLPGPMICISTGPRGECDGCCVYRVHQRWQAGLYQSQMEIISFVYATQDAARSLWTLLMRTDLVQSILIPHSSLSQPLRWMLCDGRQLEMLAMQDHVWLRLLDPIRVFKERKFPALQTPLRIHFHDPLNLAEDATLEIISDGEATSVAPTSAKPTVETDIGTLSALILGGNSVWDLANAGRISFDGAQALEQLAYAFMSGPLPFTDTSF